MKIKFDVEEKYLYARRSYEQIQGSEDAYRQDPAKYAGQPVAAWPITSQFDIIRDYNSTTGEETNKIIESTERPWNEREFIRVDWSQQPGHRLRRARRELLLRRRAPSRASATGRRTRPSRTRCTSSAPTTATPSSPRARPTTSTSPTSGGQPDRAAGLLRGERRQSCFTVPACFLRHSSTTAPRRS